MKLLAFTLVAICVLPNNNGVEGFNEFFNKGFKKSKKITIPTTTIVQPPQCSSSCTTPCPAPPVQCPPVQCPPVQCPQVQCPDVQCPDVQCPEVHCSPVQCPTVNCPEVHCPTPEPQPCYQPERPQPCECNPETPLSPCCEDAITDSCVCEPEIIETAPCCHLKRKRRSTSNAKVVSREEDETPENDDDRY